jgi:hypothetical protein
MEIAIVVLVVAVQPEEEVVAEENMIQLIGHRAAFIKRRNRIRVLLVPTDNSIAV